VPCSAVAAAAASGKKPELARQIARGGSDCRFFGSLRRHAAIVILGFAISDWPTPAAGLFKGSFLGTARNGSTPLGLEIVG